MRRLANGNFLLGLRAAGPGIIGDGAIEIGPDHPEYEEAYERWERWGRLMWPPDAPIPDDSARRQRSGPQPDA